MKRKKLSPIHPGEVLHEEFLKPMGITKYRLAKDIHVPPQRIGDIVKRQRAITADTAMRFARYFKTSPEFWLGLQMQYDLEIAEDKFANKIKMQIKPFDQAA